MADPPKKFTFGFAKVVKKSNLVAPAIVPTEKKSKQFIDSLESNKIKLKEGEEQDEVSGPLVIPMVGPRKSSTIPNGKSIAEVVEDFSDLGTESVKQEIKQEIVEDGVASDSLEALAARELLQEGADTLKERPESTLDSLPTSDNLDLEKLQKESTLDDYENIPVNQFGLAMLRGMGWKPDEGIGKSAKLVPVTAPTVRPKGMGLGADKVILAAKAAAKASGKKDEEELKMEKGAFVKVLGGMHKNHYAQVEGFADDSGRVVLKLAIGGHVVSVNEGTVCLVSKSDYSKNSKVLNAAKYDEFKKKEETGVRSPSPEEKPRHKSSSSSQASKQLSLYSDKSKDYSPNSRSSSPKPRLKKEKHYSRSSSRSPNRCDKKSSQKDHSPSRTKSLRNNPDLHCEMRHGSSSLQRESSSSSPHRIKKQKSSRRSRSFSRSPSRDKHSHRKKNYSDSDSDSKTHKKKKKKQKERKRARSSSISDNQSRSRSKSPKSKKKSKKSRKSRSRSPSHRKRR